MNQTMNFVTPQHLKTKRDYLARVNADSKAECSTVAKRFDKDYWDGDRKYGYGGYRYDGRWESVARRIIEHYGLTESSRVLDVGCGKGFLLFEMKRLLPGLYVQGLDVSSYAIEHSKPEIRESLRVGTASSLPYEDKSFDLVLSIMALHNLKIFDLVRAIEEINRVSRKDSYIVVESYRNEVEKVNLLYWQLTCESFYSPEEWRWLYKQWGYSGDHEFVYFD